MKMIMKMRKRYMKKITRGFAKIVTFDLLSIIKKVQKARSSDITRRVDFLLSNLSTVL